MLKIGTDHDVTDASYYDTDVLYFDDHGVYTLAKNDKGKWKFADNPSVPLGVDHPDTECTPYIFAYAVSDLGPFTRKEANADDAPAYTLALSGEPAKTALGGDGEHAKIDVTLHNWGFASSGHVDLDGITLPVSVEITGSSTGGVPNKPDPIAGFNYENPMVGAGQKGDLDGDACTNDPPLWMQIQLTATARRLTPGAAYNLYEYVFDSIAPVGPGTTSAAAALAVPISSFNANAGMAKAVHPFTAQGESWSHVGEYTSSQIVVFRCVLASAP